MSLNTWAAKKTATPEEKAAALTAKKEQAKADKKERAAKVKETAKAAEKASEQADKWPTSENHKAAAEAHRVAEKAASTHYFNSRMSRMTSERLHDDMRAHMRDAKTHDERAASPSAKAMSLDKIASATHFGTVQSAKGRTETAAEHTKAADASFAAAKAHREAAKTAPDKREDQKEHSNAAFHDRTPGTHDSWKSFHTERAEMHAADGNHHAKKAIALGGEDKWARDEQGRFTSK